MHKLLTIHADEEEVVANLEALDDTIFAAINGDDAALAQASSRWRDVVTMLGHEIVEESRAQYLRYAKDVWHANRDDGHVGREQATAALNIISLLTF